MKNHLKVLMIATVAAAAQVQLAHAQTFVVPGTADPWLANGGTDDYLPGNGNLDTTPAQSPVAFGAVTPGGTISWSATGSTGNTPTPGNAGPNGSTIATYIATPSDPIFAALPTFSAPVNSLIGVFTGPGYADIFEMGDGGSITVPAGAADFYMGSMDGYQWNNNSGAFDVNISTVPDGGTTLALLGGTLLGLQVLRRKLSV
jgi:hypothetical protein